MPKPKNTNKNQVALQGHGAPAKLVKQVGLSELSDEHKLQVFERLGWLKKAE